VNATKEKFAKLHALGWTFKEIAAALGVTVRVLYKWRGELNLPRRPRGRPRKPEVR